MFENSCIINNDVRLDEKYFIYLRTLEIPVLQQPKH